MKFYILTLFPEMVEECMQTSILGRAQENGIIRIETVNIRDYSGEKHGHVDDYPYGGGAGMIMQAEPILKAFRDISGKCGERAPRLIYTTPKGKLFTQDTAKKLSSENSLIFLCGHYEGIDERVLELAKPDCFSIGDYVLTGGELPAMVMIDAISRLVPGVLTNDSSPGEESLENGLLEYPQYTRPETVDGISVPDVLLSGNHKNIGKWRREQSLRKTYFDRPDLIAKADLSEEDRKYINSLKR